MKDFFSLFESCGLRRDSGSYNDYETGKDLLRDHFPDRYEEGIVALKEYLWL